MKNSTIGNEKQYYWTKNSIIERNTVLLVTKTVPLVTKNSTIGNEKQYYW